jgi:hypothetical protein
VDGDVFGKVGRLGRHAADALHRALDGERWEPFHASKCLDAAIARACGVPLLTVVRAELQGLRAVPLLARASVEGVLRRIREAAIGPNCGVLDLVLRSVTERALLRGEYETRTVLERHGSAQLQAARGLLAPIAAAGADVLESRPHLKRLDLARAFKVTTQTDLLGGP